VVLLGAGFSTRSSAAPSLLSPPTCSGRETTRPRRPRFRRRLP